MAIEPAVWPVIEAVQALRQPVDHTPTFFAPDRRGDVAELEYEAMDAARTADACVVTAADLGSVAAARDKIAHSLSQRRHTIILSADLIVIEPQYQEITAILDRKQPKSVGFLSAVFENKDTFSANYFNEPAREKRCRLILVKNTPARDAVLTGSIMNLLDAHFGDVDVGRRAEFMTQLEELIRRGPLQGAAAALERVTDPVSGLEFYPVPRGGRDWKSYTASLPRSSKTYSRDPAGFLLDQYEPYIDSGILYSGHLRHSDRKLYDSIRMYCLTSKQYRDSDEFFTRNNILTAADLANPAPEKARRVKTIIEINAALVGCRIALGQVRTHGKRHEARRANPLIRPARLASFRPR